MAAGMGDWANERVIERMNGGIHECVNQDMKKGMNECISELVLEVINEWMNERLNEWTDEGKKGHWSLQVVASVDPCPHPRR